MNNLQLFYYLWLNKSYFFWTDSNSEHNVKIFFISCEVKNNFKNKKLQIF